MCTCWRVLWTSVLQQWTRPERKTARRERNVAGRRRGDWRRKSAGIRRSPREHAGARKKKGQPRTVDLYVLVGRRLSNKSRNKLFHIDLLFGIFKNYSQSYSQFFWIPNRAQGSLYFPPGRASHRRAHTTKRYGRLMGGWALPSRRKSPPRPPFPCAGSPECGGVPGFLQRRRTGRPKRAYKPFFPFA